MKTIKELIEELSKFDPNMKVCGQEYVNCWSGNHDDTDCSYYKNVPFVGIRVETNFTPWPQSDPRIKDKRRTRMGDEEKVVVLSVDY